MQRGDVIKALWEAAQDTGLTSRWEFWIAVVALMVLLATWKLTGPVVLAYLKTLKPTPEWDPEKGTGPLSPPMDMPKDGMPLKQEPPKDWL